MDIWTDGQILIWRGKDALKNKAVYTATPGTGAVMSWAGTVTIGALRTMKQTHLNFFTYIQLKNAKKAV